MRRVARRRGEVAVKGNGKGGHEGSSVEKRVGFGMRTRASSLMTMNDGDGHAAFRHRLDAAVDIHVLGSDMVRASGSSSHRQVVRPVADVNAGLPNVSVAGERRV